MQFSRQEYWRGLLYFLLQGIFLTQGSNLCLLWLQHCRCFLQLWATREAQKVRAERFFWCLLSLNCLQLKTILLPKWHILRWQILILKWALENITTNKASGGDGIPVELFQILEDDAVKVLHSICQQIGKTQQWPKNWKKSVFISIPKKGNAKECSNYRTIALISHASKVMLKILQARLQPIHKPWTSRCSSWF